MKPLPILGSLLLTTSPVFADDFSYLQCDLEGVMQRKEIKSNQILESQNVGGNIRLKIDFENTRVMDAIVGKWQDVVISNGVITNSTQETIDGVNRQFKISVEADPPGVLSIDQLDRSDRFSITVKVKGTCKNVDQTVFEKTLKEL